MAEFKSPGDETESPTRIKFVGVYVIAGIIFLIILYKLIRFCLTVFQAAAAPPNPPAAGNVAKVSLQANLPTFNGAPLPHESVECPICLLEFENGEDLMTVMPRSHIFHSHCLHQWFHQSSQCPICRELVTG